MNIVITKLNAAKDIRTRADRIMHVQNGAVAVGYIRYKDIMSIFKRRRVDKFLISIKISCFYLISRLRNSKYQM